MTGARGGQKGLLLGLGDELKGVVPVLQQVGGLLVVHADVVVLKQAREEVVDLPSYVQDVAHPVKGGGARGGGRSDQIPPVPALGERIHVGQEVYLRAVGLGACSMDWGRVLWTGGVF